MNQYEMRVRVRYAETDQMGVVHHANYLIWMEAARVEFCRALGFRYREMEQEDGVFLAVVEVNCRYLRPARFDDLVVVRITLSSASTRVAKFDYEILEEESGQVLSTAYTKHVFVGRAMTVVRLPERYLRMFGVPG